MDIADLGFSQSGEQYVSLEISRDSEDQNFIQKCYSASRKACQDGGTSSVISGSECNTKSTSDSSRGLFSELVEFPIPKPLSSFDVKELKEALMGDHQAQFYNDQALLGLPSPKALAFKLKKLKIRQRWEIEHKTRRFYPFLPLLIKAEINPLFTVIETTSSWILFVCWFQAVFVGNTVMFALGALALFLSLNIMHYWYGFSRYHALHGPWNEDMMSGRALDESFEQLRNICSVHCHGDAIKRGQSSMILITAPFTICNHLATLIVLGAYRLKKIIESRGEGSTNNGIEDLAFATKWGTCISNIFFTMIWLYGGPILMTFAATNFWINQRLYEALLFRRGLSGFLSSLLPGSLLVSERIDSSKSFDAHEGVLSVIEVSSTSNIMQNGKNNVKETNQKTKDIEAQAPEESVASDSLFDQLEAIELNVQKGPPLLTIAPSKESSCGLLTELTDEFEKSQISATAAEHQKDASKPMAKELEDIKDSLKDLKLATSRDNDQGKSLFARIFRSRTNGSSEGPEQEAVRPTNDESSKKSHRRRCSREVYLGLADNQGYQHFLKVVRLAAEDSDTSDYNDDVHDWIIPRVQAKTFYVKTQFGTYRVADRAEVRNFAEETYAQAQETYSLSQASSSLFNGVQSSAPQDASTLFNGILSSGPEDSSVVEDTSTLDKSYGNSESMFGSTQETNTSIRFECKVLNDSSHASVQQNKKGRTKKSPISEADCFQDISDMMCGEITSLEDDREPSSSNGIKISEEGRDDNSSLLSGSDASEPQRIYQPHKDESSGSNRLSRMKVLEEQDLKIDANEPSQWRKDAEEYLKDHPDDSSDVVVKEFIAQQAKSRRFRSKFFAGLWKRASFTLRRRKREDNVDTPIVDAPKDEIPSTTQYYANRKTSILHLESNQANDGEWDRDVAPDLDESREATGKREDFAVGDASTIYDSVIATLEEDYLADQEENGGVAIKSEGSGNRISPKTLLDYIECKLVEEFQCNNFCSVPSSNVSPFSLGPVDTTLRIGNQTIDDITEASSKASIEQSAPRRKTPRSSIQIKEIGPEYMVV